MMFKTPFYSTVFILIVLFSVALFSAPVFDLGGVETLDIVIELRVDDVVSAEIVLQNYNLYLAEILGLNQIHRIEKIITLNNHAVARIEMVPRRHRRLDENKFIFIV